MGLAVRRKLMLRVFTRNPERRVTGSWRFSSSFSSLAIILLSFSS
jgi:hypothetical protein